MVSKNKRNEIDKQSTRKETEAGNNKPAKPKEKVKEPPVNIKVALICALCFGIINSYHVSSIFENDRHFSHLSNLEREMSFRTEMGLYYSYYKTLIESESFLVGLNRLMYDNRTEYPDTINTLQRFNLMPEVVSAGFYRLFTGAFEHLNIDLPRVCYKISRGEDMGAVVSCEGIGDPMYFYLFGVWLCAGATAFLIFLHGTQLSYSLVGGFIAVSCFFFNHAEATRVQWTPALRESFAFPWSIALNIIVTHTLRRPLASYFEPLIYGTFSLIYLLCWQFSQFTIAIQLIIVYFMYAVKVISPLPMVLILFGGFYAFINNVILQFGNSFLLASPLAAVVIGLIVLYVFMVPIINNFPYPMDHALHLSTIFVCCVGMKIELSGLLGIEDDSHVLNIFKSKFTNYSDFHTLLYTCSPEFDFLPKQTIVSLSETMLIPTVFLVFGCFLGHTFSTMKSNFLRKIEKQESVSIWSGIDPGILFNFLLLAVYAGMAFLVMRLKLFLTPQLCCMASLLASAKYWQSLMKREVHIGLIVALVSAMLLKGGSNIRDQRSVFSEYSDPHLEELMHWINTETGPNAVFAGPMPTMANVLLSTRRPIVNHPHYENAHSRERNKHVYSIFSRRSPDHVYATLVSLKVNYVVLDEAWCIRRHKPGCSMVDIWDIDEPSNKQRPPLCPKLFHRTPSPFQQVFSNERYVIIQVPSKYVEIPAPRAQQL